jgi:hypothetical protein
MLKLYVWEGVLTDYTPGIAFALAPDVKTARRLILKAYDTGYDGAIVGGADFRKELAERPRVYRTPVGHFQHGGG